jgi:hypothetical protein
VNTKTSVLWPLIEIVLTHKFSPPSPKGVLKPIALNLSTSYLLYNKNPHLPPSSYPLKPNPNPTSPLHSLSTPSPHITQHSSSSPSHPNPIYNTLALGNISLNQNLTLPVTPPPPPLSYANYYKPMSGNNITGEYKSEIQD